jgi:hypothetical protein
MGITVQWALEDPVPAFIPNDIRVGLELEFVESVWCRFG